MTINEPNSGLSGFADAEHPTTIPFRVFLAYESLCVALRAVDVLFALRSKVPDDVSLCFTPWSFSALQDVNLRRVALMNVKQARLMVVSAHETPIAFSLGDQRWLAECFGHLRLSQAAVAALLFRTRTPIRDGSPRRRFLQHLAQEVHSAFCCSGVDLNSATRGRSPMPARIANRIIGSSPQIEIL